MNEIPQLITADSTHSAPVRPQERVEIIDILRGWAIFGVLLVDIERLYRLPESWTSSDRQVYQFLGLFGDAKFWTLLAFLFGLGFSLQLIRAAGRDAGFIALYRRRLLALMLIGLAQEVFLQWGGHFLVRYGAVGFLLLALRRLPTQALLPAALVFMLIPWGYSAGLDLLRERRLADPEIRAEVLRVDAERTARRTAIRREAREARMASYPRRVAVRVRHLYGSYIQHAYDSVTGWFIDPPSAYVGWLRQLGVFLVGLYVGRRRILEDIAAHIRLIRRVLIWGLAVGLVVNAVPYLIPDSVRQAYAARHLVGMLKITSDVALAFAYGSGIVLLARRALWRKLFVPLAAAGRMTLTNYLFMALLIGVMAPAFAFQEQIRPTLGPLSTVAIFAALMLVSIWWLKHFRFGPAEWFWRTLTYGNRQPMRRPPSPTLAPAR